MGSLYHRTSWWMCVTIDCICSTLLLVLPLASCLFLPLKTKPSCILMPPTRSSCPHGHCFVQWLSVVARRLYHQGKWLCNYLCLLWKASNSTTCGFLLVCTLPTTPYVWPSMSKSFTLEISGWPFLFFIYPKEEILCYQVVLRLVSAR